MEIKICKLTPDLLEDYLYFFETDAHADNPDEDRCYCVCWSSADDCEEVMSSPERRRDLAKQYINDESIQGYLAYCDGKVVGWCNANTKSKCMNCRNGKRWLYRTKAIDILEAKVKSIFCFVVAPDMKRKGIATKLLERVCKDASVDGFDFVEAYPNKFFTDEFTGFMGPYEMYKKFGFAIESDSIDEKKFIVRKKIVKSMTATEKFEYWLDIAEYDLLTAKAMYNSKRCLYVTFMCQQAIEKLCKGLYNLYVDDNVPRIHNISSILLKFADKLPSSLTEEQYRFFDNLTSYYLEGRYPEQTIKLSELVHESEAQRILVRTEEEFKWLLALKL